MAKIPKGRKVDVIFGGPPCQAFSTAGNRKAFDDERGNVFLKYLRMSVFNSLYNSKVFELFTTPSIKAFFKSSVFNFSNL